MKYNEYTASEGKYLLDLNDFTYAKEMMTKHDLSIIELPEEDAKYFQQKYQEELAKQQEEQEDEKPVEEVVEEKPILLKGSKSLKTTSIEEPTDYVKRLKNLLKEEMVFKGYNLNNLVKPIIHE